MDEIQPTLLFLDPSAARAFDALAEYFERVYDALATPRKGQIHLELRAHSITAPAAERAWNLGRMVLARAAGDSVIPDDDALTREGRAMHDEVEQVIRSLNDFIAKSPIPFRKRQRCETARESAGDLLREIALEERGIELLVATEHGGTPVVLARSIHPALAAVQSYLQLLDLLEQPFRADPLVWVEREAGHWWFDTWSAPPRTAVEEDLHGTRRREFSLFDRRMLSLDDETIAAAAAQRLPEKALTPRQRALIDGVRAGVCGFFVVRQRRSHMMLLEDVETGACYEIHEHIEEHDCDEGCVMAGRLIPMSTIGWIRSPSSVYWTADAEARATLARGLRDAKGASYPTVVTEIVKATLFGEKVPRSVPPAPSRRMAADFLDDCDELLSNARGDAMQVDEALRGWLCALSEQSRGWGADHDAAQSRKDKSKRSTRRRSQ